MSFAKPHPGFRLLKMCCNCPCTHAWVCPGATTESDVRVATVSARAKIDRQKQNICASDNSTESTTRRLRLKSVWSIETFAFDEILPESFSAHFKKKKILVMTNVELGGGLPPTTDMHIQTDADYTKRVVTPFGTTRLKIGR